MGSRRRHKPRDWRRELRYAEKKEREFLESEEYKDSYEYTRNQLADALHNLFNEIVSILRIEPTLRFISLVLKTLKIWNQKPTLTFSEAKKKAIYEARKVIFKTGD